MPHQQGEVYEYLPTENLGPEREGEYDHRALIVEKMGEVVEAIGCVMNASCFMS